MRTSRGGRPGAHSNLIIFGISLVLGAALLTWIWLSADTTSETKVTTQNNSETVSCATCDTPAAMAQNEGQPVASEGPNSTVETVQRSSEVGPEDGIEMIPAARRNGLIPKPANPSPTSSSAVLDAPQKPAQSMVRASRNSSSKGNVQRNSQLKPSISPQVVVPTATPAMAKKGAGPEVGDISSRVRMIVGGKPEYYQDDNSNAVFYGYVGYQLSQALKLELRQGVTYKENPSPASDESTVEVTDTAVFIMAPNFASVTETTKLSAVFRGTIGTSDRSRADKRNGQAKIYLSSTTTLGDFSFGFGANYAKELYQETLSANGDRNVSHRYELQANMGYSLTEKLSLSTVTYLLTDTKYESEGIGFLAQLPYVEGKTYNYWNNVEAAYAVSKALSVALGLDTQAPFIDAAGRQQEFYYYKEDVSEMYLDFTYRF